MGSLKKRVVIIPYIKRKFKLSDLTDVLISSASEGDILRYDSGTSKFTNVENLLSILLDVSVEAIQDGDKLEYDSGTEKWINSAT